MERTITLSSRENVVSFLQEIHPFWMTHADVVQVEAKGLALGERRRWSKRLGRSVRACGCFSGAAAFIIALGGCVTYSLGQIAAGGVLSLQSTLAQVGIVVGSAFVGKMAGLTASRLLLRQNLRSLLRVLPADPESIQGGTA